MERKEKEEAVNQSKLCFLSDKPLLAIIPDNFQMAVVHCVQSDASVVGFLFYDMMGCRIIIINNNLLNQ